MPAKVLTEKPSGLQPALNAIDKDIQDFLTSENVDPSIINEWIKIRMKFLDFL